MIERTPNHICKNCGIAYYACNDCDKYEHWRSACDTFACYVEYCKKVEEARSKDKKINELSEN